MPRLQNVLNVLGGLILVMGGCMFTSIAISICYEYGADVARQDRDGALVALLVSSALATALGLALRRVTRIEGEINIREGFAVVGLGWSVLAGVAALPFWLWGGMEFSSYTNCYFESISGLTTTGATILTDVESLPHALLWWRGFLHWMGGGGIIVLTLALLPLLGYGVMQLFKAEVSGPTTDKLTPRVRQTAKLLWMVYVVLTVIQTMLLWGFGRGPMDLFDATIHSFSSVSTGGFSTLNTSVGGFKSAYADWVIIVFMLLGGANFTLHFHFIRFGRIAGYWKSDEFRIYLGIVGVASLVIAFYVYHGAPLEQGGSDASLALRHSIFQVLSIITTTGFVTADFELWPAFTQVVILLLMLCGGCAGSTSGGMKVLRHILLTRSLLAELKKLLHPRAIIPVRLNGRPVPRTVLGNVHSFALLYMLLIAVGSTILTARGFDLLTSISSTLTCISNVGPALGRAGPMENFAFFDDTSKWVLSIIMLIGRLELYTIIVILTPGFWRR